VAALASDTAWATAPVTASAGKFRPAGDRRGRGYAVMTQGNAAGGQPLAGVVLVGDPGQVLLAGQGHLQRSAVGGQLLDGRGAQRGHPGDGILLARAEAARTMEPGINIGRAIREQAACAYAWKTFADAEALPRDAVRIQVHLTAQAQVMAELAGGGPLSRRSRQTRQGRSVRIE
jgi:hypothetical protein